MAREYPIIRINKKAEKLLKSGHVWVYGEETEGPFAAGSDMKAMKASAGKLPETSEYKNGDIVDVVNEKGSWMGVGFINDNSKIRVRLISKNTNDRFDEAFWRRRVSYAINYRMTVMGDDFSCCRLIFGEADSFPGLTIDKFNDCLVCEVLSLGIEMRKDLIYRLLVEELKAVGVEVSVIYERNDASIRSKEGMGKYCGYYNSDFFKSNEEKSSTVIEENGIKYEVDFINGQKTGFFLDQKYNRAAAASIAKGRKVLDCFTHTGAFALNCAKAGAESVTAVDISKEAVEMVERNAQLNGLDVKCIQADVFDLLTELSSHKKGEFDYIILDPPAFTKSNATVRNAYKGYKEINLKAMKMLPRGGYLATCSCSHFMRPELFREMLEEAAADANVSLRQIEERRQAPDHPILWGVPETEYLKFLIFQVC